MECTVNGRPGPAVRRGDATVSVMAFAVAGDRIPHIRAVLNPDKLRPRRAVSAAWVRQDPGPRAPGPPIRRGGRARTARQCTWIVTVTVLRTAGSLVVSTLRISPLSLFPVDGMTFWWTVHVPSGSTATVSMPKSSSLDR